MSFIFPLERGNNKVLKALGEDGSCNFGIDIFLFSVDCSAFFESLVDDIDGFGGDAVFAHAGTQSHLPEEGYGFFYGFVGFLVGIAVLYVPYSLGVLCQFFFFLLFEYGEQCGKYNGECLGMV